ncbi:MAG: D-alanyl-D-alanine carboxypeptidase [Clostridiales bacterium]|nr:D-alanyl-D-alanine carboxypeptidase [Clostridiales bacterium]
MKKVLVLIAVLLIAAYIIPASGNIPNSEGVFDINFGRISAEAAPVYDPIPADTSMKVNVNAKAAVLMDAGTGKILMAMNPDQQLYPASVTKIMSMLLVCEALSEGKISLSDKVTCSEEAAKKGGSQIWLEPGEVMTVEELFKAMVIYSANDACTALAELIAGSEAAFVNLMNQKAGMLGMTRTHFENCTGLDDTTTSHQTSARDVAIMSRELLKYEDIFIKYTTTWMDSLRGGKTELVNTNRLVRTYKGITGLKTGTTAKAGHCVSATAKRDGLHLIAVVMGSNNSNDRFNGARAMLDWGFANYESVIPEVDKTQITKVKVLHGVEQEFYPHIPEISPVLVAKGKSKDITQKVTLATDIEAPVEKGQVVGTIEFFLGKEKLGEYKLTAPEDIKKMNLWDAILKLFGCFKKTEKDVKIEDRAKEKVTESVTEKATEAETEKKKEEKSKKKESAETTEKETKKAQESAEKKKDKTEDTN